MSTSDTSIDTGTDTDTDIENPYGKRVITEFRPNPVNNPPGKLIFTKWSNYRFDIPEVGDVEVNANDIFKEPESESIRDLAFDGNGEQLKLNDEQKKQLRRHGEFPVQSVLSPDMSHLWKTSRIIQKGYKNINNSFWKDMSRALYHIIEGVPNRIYRDDFSMWSGIKYIGDGLINIINALIGFPLRDKIYHDVDRMVEQWTFQRIMKDLELDEEGPFTYTNEDGLTIDFSLYDDNFIAKINNWISNFNENLRLNSPDEGEYGDIDDLITAENPISSVEKAFLKYIKKNKDEGDDKSRHRKIIMLVKAFLTIRALTDIYEKQAEHDIEEYKSSLRLKHSVKYEIKSWLNRKLENYRTKYYKNNGFDDYMQEHLKLFSKRERWLLESYLFHKRSDGCTAYRKSLIKDTEPKARKLKFRIWRPSHWKIKEIVPPDAAHNYEGYYQCEKNHILKIPLKFPFWKIVMFMIMFAQALRNGTYFLLVWLIFGPIGIKSQFACGRFKVPSDINIATGKLIYKKIGSWTSRFRSLYRNISKSRRKFEDNDAEGILPKGLMRFFNRFQNYFLKGVFGTLVLGIGQPLLTILNIIVTITLLVTSPAWAVCYALFDYLFKMLIYERNAPYYVFPLISGILVFTFAGIMQIPLNIIGMILQILFSGLICMWGILRASIHHTYDAFMYLIIHRWLHVPASSSFLVKHVSGPGVSSSYYYQITKETALSLLCLELSKEELSYYQRFHNKILNEPMNEVKKIHKGYLSLGLMTDNNSELVRELSDNVRHYQYRLNELIQERMELLKFRPNRNILNNIRIKQSDLSVLMERSIAMVSQFYSERVFQYVSAKKFFHDKSLEDGNWDEIVKNLYSKLFSPAFLTPLENIDPNFVISVVHRNIGTYVERLFGNDSSESSTDDIIDLTQAKKPHVLPHISSLNCSSYKYFNILTGSYLEKKKNM